MNNQEESGEQRTAELEGEHAPAAVWDTASLRTSETKYRRLYQSMRDAFVSVRMDGRIQEFNEAYRQMLGYEPEELLARTYLDITPERWHAFQARIIHDQVIQRGYSDLYEKEYRRKDGTTFPVELRTYLITDDRNQPVAMWAILRDITERKRIERELREANDRLEQRVRERTAELRASQERFELVVRGAGVGIWDWDIRTGKVYYSPRWKALFGYGEDEIGDRLEDWARLLHPDERESILKLQEDFLAGTLSSVQAEYRLRHKDGSFRWIAAHAVVVRDEQGRACRLVGSHADITDRKRAEDAIRQSEAKYRALVESCPDAVAMTDLQGQILFASERAAAQHGFLHAEELVGGQVGSLLVEGDRDGFRTNVGRLLEEGIRRNDEYRGLRRDGTTFDAEISSAVIRDAAGNPEALMGVYRDITDRKLAEKKLRARDAELFAAAEIQARLLPQQSPHVPGFDIAGCCFPAEAAAGDHFDFLPRPDGSLLVVMGDVSGHGIGPAIVAADFCARLRTLAEFPCGLPEMADKLNSGLYRETAGSIFVTTLLGRLDPIAGNLSYLNAGHPPALVLNSAGEVKASLAHGGLPLAILPDAPYDADESVDLADGDLVFFYTDGLVEVRRPGQPLFGVDRAVAIVRANRNHTAAEIVEALHAAACLYSGEEKPKDDITVVIVKVLPEGAATSPVLPRLDCLDATPPVREEFVGRRNTSRDLLFDCERCEDTTVVRVADTKYFDTEKYAQLQQDLKDFVDREQPQRLLVDLSHVEYCSTALINALLSAQKQVQAGAGVMKLCGLHPVLRETLQCLNLTGSVFAVYEDEAAAKATAGLATAPDTPETARTKSQGS